MARRASRRRESPGTTTRARPSSPAHPGNLVHLYLMVPDGRLDRDEIEESYPSSSPVWWRIRAWPSSSSTRRMSARSRWVGPASTSSRRVASSAMDPLAGFGPLAAHSLRRLAGFSNAGDLIVIGPYDEATGEVVSYEDLVGSHGGLGGLADGALPAASRRPDAAGRAAHRGGCRPRRAQAMARICTRARLVRRRSRGDEAGHPGPPFATHGRGTGPQHVLGDPAAT